jgi:hypothetical protein
MHQTLHPSRLVPAGFVVESAAHEGVRTIITVRHSSEAGICPSCGAVSQRIHSRYRRRASDLPLAGRNVQLSVIARRFRCDAVLCGRQIFAERFADGVLAPSARRTARLDGIIHHLGLALGGGPAASFAKRLMLPVSNDTLLRGWSASVPACPPTPSRLSASMIGLGAATTCVYRKPHPSC